MIGKIFGIDRLKIESDGPGITTLVGMYKCPLNCEFCINNPIMSYREYTVEELYANVVVDGLYFDHTGGGVCFGGHEPLLQQDFIIDFIKYCKNKNETWKFGLETSLNCPIKNDLFEYIDYMIVDVKTINCDIYKKYTEKSNDMVLQNLKLILNRVGDIKLRLPIIPGYNDIDDVKQSIDWLVNIGYKENQIETFTYQTTED